MHIVGHVILHNWRGHNWTRCFIKLIRILLPHMQSQVNHINLKYKPPIAAIVHNKTQGNQGPIDSIQAI